MLISATKIKDWANSPPKSKTASRPDCCMKHPMCLRSAVLACGKPFAVTLLPSNCNKMTADRSVHENVPALAKYYPDSPNAGGRWAQVCGMQLVVQLNQVSDVTHAPRLASSSQNQHCPRRDGPEQRTGSDASILSSVPTSLPRRTNSCCFPI